MYIVTTLVYFQPSSIVTDEICTACDFNRPGKTCLRKLEWVWRGEVFMAKKRYSLFSSRFLCKLLGILSTDSLTIAYEHHFEQFQ